jgi:hypothetical protein
MKKLRLELDALEVESFSTFDDAKGRGTVEGRASEAWNSNCCPQSASVPVACVCVSAEEGGTCETTCNPNDCATCNGSWSCQTNCQFSVSCPVRC